MEDLYTENSPIDEDEFYSTEVLVEARHLADQAFSRELTEDETKTLAVAVMMVIEVGAHEYH